MLAEHARDYFHLDQPSPFMSLAVPVTELARRRVPAVVHVNDTARVQTVNGKQNPFLTRMLRTFALRTGVPVLVNTSLNLKGQPIAGTPQRALDCLAGSGLDALLLGEDYWVSRC